MGIEENTIIINSNNKNNLKTKYGTLLMGNYNDTAQFLKTDVDGKLETTASISGDVNVDSTSIDTSGLIGKASGTNADFTTAYASGTTITLSSLPTGISAIGADDIASIVQIATDGSVTNVYGRDDITLSATGTDPTTLTVTGATFVASDTFIVYTNIERINDKTNITQLGDNDIDLGAGNVASSTQRTTIATDDVNLSAIKTSTELIDDTVGTIDSAAPTKGILVGTQAESTVRSAVSDGDLQAFLADLYGYLKIKGLNESTGALQTEAISSIPTATLNPGAETQLTAVGSTPAIDVGDYSLFGYQVTAAAVDTTAVVSLEGSVDGTNYDVIPLSEDCTVCPGISGITENQVTFDADGTYFIFSKAPVKYVRFTFDSETGGTAVTLDVQLFARNI